MNGCIYRTKDGECDLYVEGGKYKAFCVGDEPCEGRRQTNADRIRAMTDEELADWIVEIQDGVELQRCNYLPPLSKSWWLKWLKQGVQRVVDK